jgi:hypothetical protein
MPRLEWLRPLCLAHHEPEHTRPETGLWADGGIHAREIATPEVIMRMVD